MPNLPPRNLGNFHFERPKTQEQLNNYQSAVEFVRGFALRVHFANADLPPEVDMLVEAILANGAAVEVSRISAETHDMIAIEGMCDGTRCLLLAHQSSIQLLCTFNKREPETPPKAPIGFFVGDQQIK